MLFAIRVGEAEWIAQGERPFGDPAPVAVERTVLAVAVPQGADAGIVPFHAHFAESQPDFLCRHVTSARRGIAADVDVLHAVDEVGR